IDASPVRVIRDVRMSDVGVTAGTTVGRISGYSRRGRQRMSGARFPACAGRPLSGDMPAPSGANALEGGAQDSPPRSRHGPPEGRRGVSGETRWSRADRLLTRAREATGGQRGMSG